jgi:hypothetical protein
MYIQRFRIRAQVLLSFFLLSHPFAPQNMTKHPKNTTTHSRALSHTQTQPATISFDLGGRWGWASSMRYAKLNRIRKAAELKHAICLTKEDGRQLGHSPLWYRACTVCARLVRSIACFSSAALRMHRCTVCAGLVRHIACLSSAALRMRRTVSLIPLCHCTHARTHAVGRCVRRRLHSA